MIRNVECEWICVHGAPDALLADDAYNKLAFHHFLNQHKVQYKPRSARRHNKLGTVERKNETVKAIIYRLDSDNINADVEIIVARAVFFHLVLKLQNTQLIPTSEGLHTIPTRHSKLARHPRAVMSAQEASCHTRVTNATTQQES